MITNPAFGKWGLDEEPRYASKASRPVELAQPPEEFRPVLTVEIATGRILLDRRAEAWDRGAVGEAKRHG